MTFSRLTDESAADEVAALEAASFTNPWSRDALLWELRNSDVTRVYLVRDDDGTLAGFCTCWVIFDEVHINTMAVAAERRRQGVASALLEYVLATARAEGARKATLEVRESNLAAIRLYESMDFKIVARRPRYYTKPEEDALILWRDAGNCRS
ncbi:MAG TPA: ribosomal protein S18-alanine N-acetyltransferase [Vicinamibacterales bacterium]|nr:ribosomal protein S18-alanine N-acetyltransferase [Vicinamibacterales bacterium]